jgi:hypothetical protein
MVTFWAKAAMIIGRCVPGGPGRQATRAAPVFIVCFAVMCITLLCVHDDVGGVLFASSGHLVRTLTKTPGALECHTRVGVDMGAAVVPLASQSVPGQQHRLPTQAACCQACIAHTGSPNRCNLWVWVSGECWLKYASTATHEVDEKPNVNAASGAIWDSYSPPQANATLVLAEHGGQGALDALRSSALRAGYQFAVSGGAGVGALLNSLHDVHERHVLLVESSTLLVRPLREAPPVGIVIGGGQSRLLPLVAHAQDARALLAAVAEAERLKSTTPLKDAIAVTNLRWVAPRPPYSPVSVRVGHDKVLGSACALTYDQNEWQFGTGPLKVPQGADKLTKLLVVALNAATRGVQPNHIDLMYAANSRKAKPAWP